MSATGKCSHGYFTHSPSNRCPECHGIDDSNRDAVPVIGHGNGWLLRAADPVCKSCGGPATAGWGLSAGDAQPHHPLPSLCYSCRSGNNTKEAVARRSTHEAARGQKKQRGAKAPT